MNGDSGGEAGRGYPPAEPPPSGDLAIPIDRGPGPAEEVAYRRVKKSAGAIGVALSGGALVLFVNTLRQQGGSMTGLIISLFFEHTTLVLGVGLLIFSISDSPMSTSVESKVKMVMYIGLMFLVGSAVSLGFTSFPPLLLSIVLLAVLTVPAVIALFLYLAWKTADSKAHAAILPL